MCATYFVYGLRLWSEVPIPGLLPADPGGQPDVRVWLHPPDDVIRARSSVPDGPWAVSSVRNAHGTPDFIIRRAKDLSQLYITYADGTEFWVSADGTRVWTRWPGSLTVEDATTYLLGPVLGFVLHLRGTTCLHASVVAIGDVAVAFVGPGGAGKSTTAAGFAQRGFAVLSDDIAALYERGDAMMVPPAYKYLKVWPDSARLLLGAARALPRLTPTWDKRYIELDTETYGFQRAPLPLARVYVLEGRTAGLAAPRVEPLVGNAGLMQLVANSYVATHLDMPTRVRELRTYGRLMAMVPLWRVTQPVGPGAISMLCEAVLRDLRVCAPSEAG